ncbi:hypothetical protein VSDG_05097 [Cytospora chrysosperma]|uniref:Zn(2)-C6 fungal-type domain-containing protein n=1 Tax=Cytospora chrysosperma TaxID=252740 RepID=A0A423VYF5_CYTCH|nr:hypothetical protein VSDG_05097 [Valsa sordida]
MSVQSFRRSCDRCHVQKLKCCRNTRSPTQCQRCERAGHECVYSQRNPRLTAKLRRSASSSTATLATREEAVQPHQPPAAPAVDDVSPEKLSLEWLTPPDEATVVDPLADWSLQSFTDSPQGDYPDLFDPALYSPQTSSTSFSAKEVADAGTTWQLQELFERLSTLTKTLEDYVHFLASQWNRRDIQNYPVGEVFGTFQTFLTTLQAQTPSEKPTVLEGCQQTRTAMLASHCYTVCIKIMETLAENVCQEMSAQVAVWRPPGGDVVSGSNGPEAVDFVVGESFSHLNPLASSLVSACTMLHTGVGIVCKIEAELGVPQGNGIMANRETVIASGVQLQAPDRKGSAGFAQAAVFLGVMREGAGGDGGYINNLQNFQRHHTEILRLARQHTSAFLSQILSLQMRKA